MLVTCGSWMTETRTVLTALDGGGQYRSSSGISLSVTLPDANGAASILPIDNGSSDNCSYSLSLDITSFHIDDLGANVVTLARRTVRRQVL